MIFLVFFFFKEGRTDFFYSFVLCVGEENNVNLSFFSFYFFEFVLLCCYPEYDFSFVCF